MTTYTLRRTPAAPATAPSLDTSQQAVLAHESGPLLVLAGPGTGKTTTMVEAVVDLVDRRGVAPEQVLALTFSRKAAEQLRDRVTARLGRALGTPLSSTFHSFAYSLVRQYADDDAYSAPLRLLSAPQQDAVLRDLLRPTPEAVRWPDAFSEAVRTRGFSREVQQLLARAREHGLGGKELVAIGHESDRPEWVAAGEFLEQYLTVLDAQSALDYADLVVRAVALAEEPGIRRELRQRYSWVFVDEYQDTDPGQVALLRALAGDGRNLVVVGDPDQSIYGFRGADVRGILDFPGTFRTATGAPAPVVALRTTRRFGRALLAASRKVATAIPSTGAVPAEAMRAFRAPRSVEGSHGPGAVEVLHLDSARAEVEHVADRLRRAHLEDGLPWSEMAVLVRSGRTSIPGLRRALVAAAVPVEVAADDTPLMAEPAVQPLLGALRAALDLRHDPSHPHHVDTDRAEALLASPLGGMDAAELRGLARLLHRRERAAAVEEDRPARPSRELVRDALVNPTLLDGLGTERSDGRAVDKARRLATLLAEARRLLDDQVSAEEVLWLLWSGTRWPVRLRAAALGGGPGAGAAHRDLDALCALFEEAARTEEQRANTSAENFLETLLAQQIPADTLADRGVRGDSVRLVTAHRAKGLEWTFVVVAQVQEGSWPDLRRRSTLLRADELGPDGVLPPLEPRALLAEERRLFYVACTRARSRLLVTAVASPDEDGDQPSRFTGELGVEPRAVQGRPSRPLSLDGLVAELRRTAADPDTAPALRDAAVRRLARLARERHGDGMLVPAADPGTWWGTRARSWSTRPVRPADQPITLSASALDALLTCPAKWFLEREAGGRSESSASQGFGNVVHGLADRLVKGDFDDAVTTEQLMAHVDKVWEELPFRTPWSSAKDRKEIEAALTWLLDWHRRPAAREVLGTEVSFETEVSVAGEVVRLKGFADRLEVDADGRVVVVDLKTTKQHPTAAELAEHPQLGLYQLAVDHGAVDHLLGRPGEAGGAELVQLRGDLRAAKVQRQDPQRPGDDGHRPVELQLAEAVRRLRDEEFPARAGKHCDHCDFTALCPTKRTGTVLS
ncbi:MAG TPA: ATP-dependent DNA helicase [Marmoricola sp.]|nr:ATP-dependent DNA helicase [Marmoricola sp.]